MKRVTSAVLTIAAFTVASAAPAYAACTATSNSAIADKIANGHAWGKHKSEFVSGKVIAGLSMPSSQAVTTVSGFKSHILSAMSASPKNLQRGRRAYWKSSTGTIVIYDPNSNDCGTAFRPTAGKSYYDSQN